MKKQVKHSRNLSRLIKDPSMTPSRRLLAEMLLLSIDSMDTPLGERFLRLTERVFGGRAGQFKESDITGNEEDSETDSMSDALKSVYESLDK